MPFMIPGVDEEHLGWPPPPMSDGTDLSLHLSLCACAWAGWAIDRLTGVDSFGPLIDPLQNELNIVPLIQSGK